MSQRECLSISILWIITLWNVNRLLSNWFWFLLCDYHNSPSLFSAQYHHSSSLTSGCKCILTLQIRNEMIGCPVSVLMVTVASYKRDLWAQMAVVWSGTPEMSFKGELCCFSTTSDTNKLQKCLLGSVCGLLMSQKWLCTPLKILLESVIMQFCCLDEGNVPAGFKSLPGAQLYLSKQCVYYLLVPLTHCLLSY